MSRNKHTDASSCISPEAVRVDEAIKAMRGANACLTTVRKVALEILNRAFDELAVREKYSKKANCNLVLLRGGKA